MSSDAFSTPVRKYDFGKDVQLAGQARVVGASYKMQDYLCWSRTDQLTCAAGINTYLTFDVPPLPAGSVIRATAYLSSSGASDFVSLGYSTDWLVAAPTLINIANPPSAATGETTIHLIIRSRNASHNVSTNTGGSVGGANASVDWGISNRLAVYGNETTAMVIQFAFVQVFVSRVYR